MFYLFFTSYAMDGLSADKLRIFLQPVETESKPKVKSHENDSAGSEETAVTTMPSVAKQDQVNISPGLVANAMKLFQACIYDTTSIRKASIRQVLFRKPSVRQVY